MAIQISFYVPDLGRHIEIYMEDKDEVAASFIGRILKIECKLDSVHVMHKMGPMFISETVVHKNAILKEDDKI